MRWFIIIIFLPILLFSQTYIYQDSVKGSTPSNTAFASAENRLHFGSYYIPTSNYAIAKVILYIQTATPGSPTMNFTMTVYDNDDGNTNPNNILGTSPDSMNASVLLSGDYYPYEFTFNPPVSVTAGDTIWIGPSSDAYNVTHYPNLQRYTDLSTLTRRSADQVSWISYLSTPLALEVYSLHSSLFSNLLRVKTNLLMLKRIK